MRPYASLVLFLSTIELVQGGNTHFSRLRGVLDRFTSYSYDEIHELVVLDQIEAYIKPIKSVETRNFKSLNGLYDFCFDPNAQGFKANWFERSLVEVCKHGGERNYYRMPVPSAFNDIMSNRTAKNYVGWIWYQTTIFWQDQWVVWDTNTFMQMATNWILQIESVNYLSVVWIQVIHDDGKMESHLVGSHVGGHLPVTLNVSSVLNKITTRNIQLRLTIAVNNLLTDDTIPSGQLVNMTKYTGRPYYKFQPDFDFFNFAGIMGDVRLIRLAKNFIEDVEVLPSEKGHGQNRIQVRLCLNAPNQDAISIVQYIEGAFVAISYWPGTYNGTIGSVRCSQSNDVDDREECSLEERCKYLIICNNEMSCRQFEKYIEWPSSESRLTKMLFTLNFGGDGSRRMTSELPLPLDKHIDSFELRFAHRANMHRLISENTGQLQGFGMHHEQLFSGRTMSLPAIMKDLYLLKQMGANVIRTTHYPYSRAYLEACDEMGLMVIAECPAVGLGTFSIIKLMLHKQILLEMMQRDHDHPSIVMWSLANEPQSQHPEARAYFESLLHYARNDLKRFTIKAGRPLAVALAQSHSDDKIGDLFDVLMINRYYGWYECTGLPECIRYSLLESLTGWSAKYGRNKPVILSEFGADTIAGLHSNTADIFSEEFQRDLIVEFERVFDDLAANRSSEDGKVNFLGAMIWNFADFSTHESLSRVGGNKKGIFTGAREPKLATESVRQIYRSRMSRKAY